MGTVFQRRDQEIPHVPPPKRHPYDQWSPDARALDLVGDKWTLLIIRDLVSGPRRFVELQRVLPGISTEQLRSRLNRMVADGMLTRQRYREVPPRVDYELTERARELAPVLGELARWGYEWAWGPPRPSERVDLGAIFRLIPGLVRRRQQRERDGRADRLRRQRRSADVVHGHALAGLGDDLRTRAGQCRRADRAAPSEAWIRALSPHGARAGLRSSGDRALADAVLRILALSEGGHAAEQDSVAAPAA